MFAYCGNNPINRNDSAGQSWILAALIVACAVLLSSCGNNEPIIVPESGPYSSADDAARGFAQEAYAASSYIRHEYAATIYAETNDGVTTYNYTKPYSGDPHSVAIGYKNIPAGATVVAYIHTHPNYNDFSYKDKIAACELRQNLYLVNPDHQLQMYSPFENKTYSLGYISPSMLTDDQKSALVNQFKISWDTHLGSCDFQCEKKLWPTP